MNVTLGIMIAYLALLLVVGVWSNRLFRGTAVDFFVASRSIGPFMLLMAVFGTAMTAFTLVGAAGEGYRSGVVTYAKLASWSGLIHAACIFTVGIPLWAIGKKHGYVTQCQYFRARFDSPLLGYLLFPAIVVLLVPYVLIGIMGGEGVVAGLTSGMFPETFAATDGAVPKWLSGLVISVVVLTYVFAGGVRGTIWANTLQTVIFIITAAVAFVLISDALGGVQKATQMVADSEQHAHKLANQKMVDGEVKPFPLPLFVSYCLVPLSIAMFPHIFQNWLTAKSARAFKTVVVFHPICMMLVWAPCVLIGLWATAAMMPDGSLVVPAAHKPNTQLAIMVQKLTTPTVAGLLGAGILAAIMSSLDSQFMCVGTMFTNDVVVRLLGEDRVSDRQRVLWARGFIIGIVAVTYLISLVATHHVFKLGIWVFSGFAGLFPLVVAALYWKRTTKAAALASLLVTLIVWLALFYAANWGQAPLDAGALDAAYGIKAPDAFFAVLPATWVFAACLVTVVLVSLVTPKPKEETIAKFFPT